MTTKASNKSLLILDIYKSKHLRSTHTHLLQIYKDKVRLTLAEDDDGARVSAITSSGINIFVSNILFPSTIVFGCCFSSSNLTTFLDVVPISTMCLDLLWGATFNTSRLIQDTEKKNTWVVNLHKAQLWIRNVALPYV